MAMAAEKMEQRIIAGRLGVTQTAVYDALALDRKMKEMGLTTPYMMIGEPPSDYHKLRRHKNPKYRFEAVEGFQQPPLTEIESHRHNSSDLDPGYAPGSFIALRAETDFMTTKKNKSDKTRVGPVARGSPLYSMIQLLASAVAEHLRAGGANPQTNVCRRKSHGVSPAEAIKRQLSEPHQQG